MVEVARCGSDQWDRRFVGAPETDIKWNRGVPAVDPLRRSIEEMESVRHHTGNHLGVDATPWPGFPDTKQTRGSGDRGEHGVEVKRLDASQVNHFDLNVFLAQLFRCSQRFVNHGAVSHNGKVPAWAGNPGFVKRQSALREGISFQAVIEILVLTENDRVIDIDGFLKHGVSVFD